MEGMGVEGHVGAIGPGHDVGDQAVGVELGVALARGAVHEGGHLEALRPHPPAHAALLAAGVGGLVLQERQGGGDGLGVGPGDDRRRLGRPERPQQRHRLGTGVGGVEGERLPLAVAFQQVDAGYRTHALDQGPQLVGLHHARKAQLGGPAALPHPGRLADAEVVLVDAECHRGDEVLGVTQRRDVQHGTAARGRVPPRWHVSVVVAAGVVGRRSSTAEGRDRCCRGGQAGLDRAARRRGAVRRGRCSFRVRAEEIELGGRSVAGPGRRLRR
jgi:hypothetical protein